MDCPEIRETVQLHFLLGTFSWTHQFKILQEGPFAIILGLDFLGHSQMVVDLAKESIILDLLQIK